MMAKRERRTQDEAGGTVTGADVAPRVEETVTEAAPRPDAHLELVRAEAGPVHLPTELGGGTLPPGARMDSAADGAPRITLPAHTAMPRLRDKCAIIGFTPSRLAAPWADNGWEFWGLNALYVHSNDMPLQRFARWFDLHAPQAVANGRLANYRKLGCPVYLQQIVEDMPQSVEFPKAEIEAFWGDTYFTNSISWMLAFAGMMGFSEIRVYGVDMATDSEYRFQRPNVEYWIGKLRGRGIKVSVAETSDLLKASHQYGYGTDHGLRAKLKERLDEFTKRERNIEAEIQRLTLARATVNGARQNVEWMLQSWTVADHTSMTPDVAAVAPEAAVGQGG